MKNYLKGAGVLFSLILGVSLFPQNTYSQLPNVNWNLVRKALDPHEKYARYTARPANLVKQNYDANIHVPPEKIASDRLFLRSFFKFIYDTDVLLRMKLSQIDKALTQARESYASGNLVHFISYEMDWLGKVNGEFIRDRIIEAGKIYGVDLRGIHSGDTAFYDEEVMYSYKLLPISVEMLNKLIDKAGREEVKRYKEAPYYYFDHKVANLDPMLGFIRNLILEVQPSDAKDPGDYRLISYFNFVDPTKEGGLHMGPIFSFESGGGFEPVLIEEVRFFDYAPTDGDFKINRKSSY